MSTKKIVAILIGITLVAFGIGLLSLNHYGFNINQNNGINIGLNGIDINSNGSKVKIGPGGIHIEDGDDKVSVGIGGINIEDGNKDISLEVNSGFSGWIKDLFNGITITSKDLIEKDIDEEKFEEIDGINHIKIETSFIDVNIITENRNDIKIRYNGHLRANYIPELETDKSGNTLRIYFKRNKTSSYTVTSSNVKLDVYIPNTYKDNIDIISSSGDVYISNMELSQLDLSASSGYITVDNITTDSLYTQTSSGDQIIKNVTSMKSNLNASSGTLEVSNYKGDLYANTSSGDMKFDYSTFDNSIIANASSGEIEIILPNDSQFNLNANTSSGQIKVDFPIKISRKDDDSLSGTVGNSFNNIKVTTSSGDIWIRNK